MGLRIRTNVQSLNAQRHMGMATEEVGRSTEKLSSGYRINKGADDAAGFAIAEVLRADVRSLGQARRNANDGDMWTVRRAPLDRFCNPFKIIRR